MNTKPWEEPVLRSLLKADFEIQQNGGLIMDRYGELLTLKKLDAQIPTERQPHECPSLWGFDYTNHPCIYCPGEKCDVPLEVPCTQCARYYESKGGEAW